MRGARVLVAVASAAVLAGCVTVNQQQAGPGMMHGCAVPAAGVGVPAVLRAWAGRLHTRHTRAPSRNGTVNTRA